MPSLLCVLGLASLGSDTHPDPVCCSKGDGLLGPFSVGWNFGLGGFWALLLPKDMVWILIPWWTLTVGVPHFPLDKGGQCLPSVFSQGGHKDASCFLWWRKGCNEPTGRCVRVQKATAQNKLLWGLKEPNNLPYLPSSLPPSSLAKLVLNELRYKTKEQDSLKTKTSPIFTEKADIGECGLHMQASWHWMPELGKSTHPDEDSAGTVSPCRDQGYSSWKGWCL